MKNYKCDHCKTNDASYYYRSNVNGQVSETHLCADCARELGADQNFFAEANRMMHRFDSLFDSFLPAFGRGFSGFMMPALVMPGFGFLPEAQEAGGNTATAVKQRPGVDPEMEKRRQINMLREQMNAAAAEENFEKAAELRDQIRKMENNEKSA